MDVTDEESVKAGAKHIEGIDDKLDILVNKFVHDTFDAFLRTPISFVAPDLPPPFATLTSSRKKTR